MTRIVRGNRRQATRVLILDTAERLFAERGVFALSSRQIAEAAGQGNTAVVGYHFGTKADLVRAITHRFTADVENSRAAMLAEMDPSAGIREWLGCLVRPWIDHFAKRDTTYFARLCAQVMTDSSLKAIMTEEAKLSPTLQRTRTGLAQCLPAMPDRVAAERGEIVQQVIVHMCADREGALATGAPTLRSSWRGLERGLTDALAGIWTAPCTSRSHVIDLGRRA
jgi:AcrR family transcriptional regulator